MCHDTPRLDLVESPFVDEMFDRIERTSSFEGPDLLVVLAFEVEVQPWSGGARSRRRRSYAIESFGSKDWGTMNVWLDQIVSFANRFGRQRKTR